MVLDAAPSGEVVVSVTAGAGATVDKHELTFTMANWATAQTVTVSGVADDDIADETVTVSHAVKAGSAAEYVEYVGVDIDAVTVTVDDDAGVTVMPRALTVDEGASGTYTVVLDAAPSGEVVVSVTAGAGATVDKHELTFTMANWATAQTVTVSGAADDDVADETVRVSHAVKAGSATEYVGVVVDAVTVTVDDAGVTIFPPPPTELKMREGDTSIYTMVLDNRPAGNVVIDIAASPDPHDLILIPASLTFTTADWATAQTVRVRVAEDADEDDDDVTITNTIRADSTSAEYVIVTIADVEVQIDDNDDAGVSVKPQTLTLGVGGMAEYTVKLDKQPTASVTVTIAVVLGGAGLTLDETSLAFTTSDWNMPQTVTVTAGPAAIDATIRFGTANDSAAEYRIQSVISTASVTDDVADTPAVTVTPALMVNEGETATYTVALAALPAADVTVTVSGHSGTDVSVGGAPLTFSTATWATAQTVTVTAADDTDAVDDVVTLTHNDAGGDYGAVPADLTVTVVDDDAGVRDRAGGG